MNDVSDSFGEAPRTGKLKGPFFCMGIEVFDVFLPIMGADCLAIYGYFKRIEFKNPKLAHSVRGIHEATGLGESTVSRSLEILEHLGLIKLTRFRGSKESQCHILDSKEVALGKGAQYNKKTVSYSLPPDIAHQLRAEVKALREKQQGKPSPRALRGTPGADVNAPFCASQRNAGVSPEKRQRRTRETQAGFHLIREERRIEEVPPPTPAHDGELWKTKNLASEDGPVLDSLRWAKVKFTGVMKDIRSHLFDIHIPPIPHLTNLFADWQEFGFDSLAVERTAWRGKALTLVLSASDPAAARRGLEKYHRKWDESLRKWYECEVSVELVEARRQ